MIVDTIQKALPAVAQMTYENWVSILLAALAVLLAVATLIVAIAGIAIAIVGIWGIRALRKAAEQKAHESVRQAIAKYPDATDFIKVHQQMRELYRLMQQHLSAFKQEFEMLHQRSEDASAILDRLRTQGNVGASNGAEAVDEAADIGIEPMSAIYPGEEAGSDGSDTGKSS
jgi:uncharacterized protein HemX